MIITLTPVPGSFAAHARWEAGALTCNGAPRDPAAPIEYGEAGGCTTFSDDPDVWFEVIPSTWTPPPPTQAELDAAAAQKAAALLESEREAMTCTRLQAMLALGETRWQVVTAAIAAQPWEVRARFEDAAEWRRLNPLIAMLGGQVLGLTDTQLDDLFRLAATK
jgi:hypothetical protein